MGRHTGVPLLACLAFLAGAAPAVAGQAPMLGEELVDKAGRECAYYDTTLLFPGNAATATLSAQPTGVAVLDMTDPAKPVRTATPAMQTPHESLLVNEKRGR